MQVADGRRRGPPLRSRLHPRSLGGRASIVANAGTDDGARDQTRTMTATTPHPPSGDKRPHTDSWLDSIGKAIVAPVQGAQGSLAAAHPEPDQTPSPPPAGAEMPHELPDQRDPRTVGDNHDGILKALGKAIVAPIDGAHEVAPARRRGPAPP